MSQKTQLYDQHVAAGARMVDFGGFQMPLHYGSQIDEHHAVRQSAGMFDVSHMCVVDISGEQAEQYLRKLLANDVARLAPQQALYSCMLTDDAGVVDDLIVYRCAQFFRLVVNAGTRVKDLAWMRSQQGNFSVDIKERTDLGIIAVQGPRAVEIAAQVLGEPRIAGQVKRFYSTQLKNCFLGRTGYTGEDGFEIVAANSEIDSLWQQLLNNNVVACGLGSRDSLRLEAGLNLYGQDMDESTSPWISNLGWTIDLKDPDREFLGRAALEKEKAAGISMMLVGLILEERGVMRHGQSVNTDAGAGLITSGGFAPTLNGSIALARIPLTASPEVGVEIRSRELAARWVRPPFVRNSKSVHS